MKTKHLTPNPSNPRTISDEKLAMLQKSLAEFGDLGGIVFNRKSKQLIGGHQRLKIVGNDAQVTIERKYPKPTRTGTVAEGFIEIDGERFSYREVSWDDAKEKAANIAANKGAGDWDLEKLGDWFRDLGDFGVDLDLTMFDEDERESYLTAPKAKEPEPPSTSGVGQRDIVECPNCGYIRGLTPGKKR